MKKIVLFNLAFVQSKKWAQYHGGAENDFTVFMELLDEIGNHPEWKVYGHFIEGQLFVRDIQPILATYKNLHLISNKELDKVKRDVVFHSIYSSDMSGLEWIINKQLRSYHSVVVIHGIRRYELQVGFFDLFLPNRFRDKIFILKSFFVRRSMRKNIEKYHQDLFAKMRPEIHLVATSHDTRNKLLAMCAQLQPAQVRMLYTSCKTLVSEITSDYQDEQVLRKYNLEAKKYFLLISLGRIEKNIYFALKNLRRLCKEHNQSFKIFACGESKKNWVINKFKRDSNIEIKGYVPGEDLRVLYKHAFLFVYPTRSEGFGMPILEAMEHGTPVCCTALSPLIEVGGSAIECFSLNNDIEFRSKILKFCLDDAFYENKRQLSFLRYQEITELQKQHLKKKREFILHGPL